MDKDNEVKPPEGLSRYVLTIHHSTISPDVLRFRGREALSEPFCWNIEFTTPQANILPEQVLMKYASLQMQGGRTVYGIITRLEWFSTSADQSHYSVTLSSRLALLSRTRQCRVFLNQSVPEVVEQVLREHGLEGADFDFRLEREYPERELITQWRESDLTFIERILAEVGIWWRTEMDGARGLDVTLFADSQLNYHFDVRLPYREPSGLHDDAQEAVWGVRTWHNAVTGGVQTRDYHYPAATTPLDATVRVRSPAVTTGEHYRYAEPYREQGDDTDPEPAGETGAFYARIHHERELNYSLRVHLFSNACSLTPGVVLEPQGDVIRALKDGVIITLTTFRASRDSRLHVSVWGMPYSERYCYRPPEIPRPEIHGTVPARVENRDPKDTYAWLDNDGRYRVKLDMDREGGDSGYSYLWVRQAKPYAGDTYGWHTPLLAGTEVAIAFDGGDPDRPYIAHAFHDSAHPDVVNRDNRSRNILRTPAQNELRMEDKRGEEHIHLTTEYGKTQLGEGRLVDAQDKERGAGFELRTDEYGVIRVAKGLFISADGQQKAAGEVLDRETALKEIDLCLQQIAQLSTAADAANALQADIASQSAMFSERLKPLNEMIHVSAPEGIAFTSGEHMQLAATKNVAVSAGGDISVGVMGNMTALAGEKLGLFAHSGPLSLKSGEGPVEVQAQNGGMQLAAEKKLTITSLKDISFAGKKRITLIGGGSYLKLEAGKIEYGTPQVYLRKVERTFAARAIAKNDTLLNQSSLNGAAKKTSPDTGPDILISETVQTIPENRSKRRVGVGEVVKITCSNPVSEWFITPNDKAKLQALGNNSAALTVFDKAGDVTVTATTINGKNTAQFTIIEPSAFVMKRMPDTELIHHNGVPDCGWLGRPYLHPVDINFSAVCIRERDSQAIGTGPYKSLTGRWHGRYNPADPKNGTSQWFRIDADEYSATYGSTLSSSVTDTIFAGIGDAAGINLPFSHCLLYMPIIWEWSIDQSKVHPFPESEQRHEILVDGKCTTSKASHKETTLYSDPDSGLDYIKR